MMLIFQRSECACPTCVGCCKSQPGCLAPGDFERIRDYLGQTDAEAKTQFWASPGAMVMDGQTGRQYRVGTITPKFVRGRCVFLDAQDRCRIHPVSPFGCSQFSACTPTAMDTAKASWLVVQQRDNPAYKALRADLPFATHHKPRPQC